MGWLALTRGITRGAIGDCSKGRFLVAWLSEVRTRNWRTEKHLVSDFIGVVDTVDVTGSGQANYSCGFVFDCLYNIIGVVFGLQT